jgi:hypothetical protein
MTAHGIKGWLSRSPDGRYVFSRSRPILARITGTDHLGLYPEIGDAFFTGAEKSMCEAWCELHGIVLGIGETVQCSFTMQCESHPIQLVPQ